MLSHVADAGAVLNCVSSSFGTATGANGSAESMPFFFCRRDAEIAIDFLLLFVVDLLEINLLLHVMLDEQSSYLLC